MTPDPIQQAMRREANLVNSKLEMFDELVQAFEYDHDCSLIFDDRANCPICQLITRAREMQS